MARKGYSSITIDDGTIEELVKIQKNLGLSTLPETIRFLIIERGENFMENINYKVGMLLSLVDFDKNPFLYTMLEIDATKEQVEAVYDLMDKTEQNIVAGKKTSHHEFEAEIYKIFPKHHGSYHLAEGIVGSLGKQGRWETVYNYMKKNGMNPSNM